MASTRNLRGRLQESEWSRLLRDLEESLATDEIQQVLADWSVHHKRRSNLWRDICKEGLPIRR